MTQPSLSEILATFNAKPEFQNPFTTFMLEEGWDSYRETDLCRPPARSDLRAYLKSVVKPVLSAINIGYLQELTTALQARLAAEADIQYQDYGVTTELPSYSEVQQSLQKIYSKVSEITAQRDECNYYTSLLKQAAEIVTSLRKTTENFVQDETILSLGFTGVADRKRFAEVITGDLDVYAQRLATLRGVTVALHDDILQPRMTALLRTDSALRMLVKVDETDRGFNRGMSRNDTEAPVPNTDINSPSGPISSEAGLASWAEVQQV